MKRYFLIGGFIGFAITFTSSFTTVGNLNLALRDAMIGCLLVAFGFRFIYKQIEMGALHILQTEAEMEQDGGPEVNGNHAYQLNNQEGSNNDV